MSDCKRTRALALSAPSANPHLERVSESPHPIMTDRTDDRRRDRDRETDNSSDGDDELGNPERQERTAQRQGQEGRRDSSSEGQADHDPREGDTHRQRSDGSEAGRQHRSEGAEPHGSETEGVDATETAATSGGAGDEAGQEPTRAPTDDEEADEDDEDPVSDAETGDRSGGGLEHDQDRLRDESGNWTDGEGERDDEREQ
ncbi:hypothetical protein [Natronococcus pandeyae]|nr:hypothetical protein [Natronococcus pandeyae]